ncbi:MAG: ribosomal protein S18-alanine N-acetyltransferase [Deltaproteobacteria bacterium]|nr:ribosomal protein S18-alanine N-acetyltransferase [Deltaproteobacteria bacterium]
MITPTDVRLRSFQPADLPALVALEAALFPDPWSYETFASTLHHATTAAYVAEHREHLVGYALVRTAHDHADLLTIGVAPTHQRCGVGRLLIDTLIGHCRHVRVTALFLEVRRENHSAQAFYRRLDFVEIGVRRGYYRHPIDDAIVMQRVIGAVHE